MPDDFAPPGDDAIDNTAEMTTLAALVRLSPPPPTAAFARTLKEDLMRASFTNGKAAPTTPADTLSHRLAPAVARWRRPAASLLTTAALLAVTLLGAFALRPTSPVPQSPTQFAAVAPGTPLPLPGEPADAAALMCRSADVYFGCPQLARAVGAGYIPLDQLDELPAATTAVTLAGWALTPGTTYSPEPAAGPAASQGVVMDVVLTGAYQATFSVPVVVVPGSPVDQVFRYLEPGTLVELVAGDSVTYALGGLGSLTNPLQSQRLEFKRATISAGESEWIGLPGGVTTTMEATGILPQPLADYGADLSLGLWYLQVREGAFPPPAWQDPTTLVLGPVDPQRGPTGTEGFVLVIRPALG